MLRLTSKCSNFILFLIMPPELDILHQLVRPPLAAKKKKGDTVTPSGADSSAVVTPSSVGRGATMFAPPLPDHPREAWRSTLAGCQPPRPR